MLHSIKSKKYMYVNNKTHKMTHFHMHNSIVFVRKGYNTTVQLFTHKNRGDYVLFNLYLCTGRNHVCEAVLRDLQQSPSV